MNDVMEQKQTAKQLRQQQQFDQALTMYRSLWDETEDAYDGAGLLHCLRKLELFEEAICFARELIAKHPSVDWCRNEVIWALISGSLHQCDETEDLGRVVEIASEIMDLKPEGVAAKVIVFKVLKTAKAVDDWETINEWVAKIDLKNLSSQPMTDNSGREGWSDQAVWYNYRIRGLIKKGEFDEASLLVDSILEEFPRQRKFFMRLKALAKHSMGQLDEADRIYSDLCNTRRPDWWMIYEHAKVVRDRGKDEYALKLMCQAAGSHSKLDGMVSLFADIGVLCMKTGRNEEARSHLLLCKQVRERNGWAVPQSVMNPIHALSKSLPVQNTETGLKENLSDCRKFWKALLGSKRVPKGMSSRNRYVRSDLTGQVRLGHQDRPFCFIVTKDRESIYCFKTALPPNIKDGDSVRFDAIPSFDKKKNRESWKANNIRVS